jgi:hypothetical protein
LNKPSAPAPALFLRDVVMMWWPLAASWALMTLETPVLSAMIARMPESDVNLAAWGGIIFPFTLFISSPIMMLLSASNVLSTDRESYRRLLRYTNLLGFGLTALHLLVALTPLYGRVARNLLNAPEVIIAPARIGLIIVTPWSWTIAFRRIQQGVMIRYGHAKAVSTGTTIRLAANFITLLVGYASHRLSGIVAGCIAVAVGVTTEAVFTGLRVRTILKHDMPKTQTDSHLTLRTFTAFYFPLMLTSLMMIVVMPIASAAMSRMPNAMASLATWPTISGLIYLLRSPGFGFNEVVVATLGSPKADKVLWRFSLILMVTTTAIALMLMVTPLADLWLNNLMALSSELASLGKQGLWFALFLPLQTTLISWYQGTLVYHRNTRAISEAVAIYLGGIVLVMGAGIAVQRFAGLPVSILAYELAGFAQVLWLFKRVRGN